MKRLLPFLLWALSLPASAAGSFAFQPLDPRGSQFVGNSAVQIEPLQPTSNVYRVVNLSTSTQCFTWGQSTVTSAGQPSAGVPSSRTVCMLGSTVETFTGIGPYMIASSATGFLVTNGDGE